MTDLLQDGPGCAEGRRYARWFADRLDAMWLLRKAHNERGLTTMTTPDLTQRLRDFADTYRGIDELGYTGLMTQAVDELERLRQAAAQQDEAINWVTKGVQEIIAERDVLRAKAALGMAMADAAAQLAELERLRAQVAPADVTPEMLRAGQMTEAGGYVCSSLSGAYELLTKLFKAMLAAAPAQQAEPVFHLRSYGDVTRAQLDELTQQQAAPSLTLAAALRARHNLPITAPRRYPLVGEIVEVDGKVGVCTEYHKGWCYVRDMDDEWLDFISDEARHGPCGKTWRILDDAPSLTVEDDPENDPPAREASDWAPGPDYDGDGSVAAMARRAAAQPAAQAEPVADLTPEQLADKCESWLQTGTLTTNVVDAYEAGYRDCEAAHAAAASKRPAQGVELTFEQRRAVHEAERNAAADRWFAARADWVLDCPDARRKFEAGFDAAKEQP